MSTKKEETYTLEVEGYKATLRKPSRAVLGQAMGMMVPVGGQVPDVTQAGEWILTNCWVSGDEEIKTNESLLVAACMAVMQMIEMKVATIKKN